MDGRRHDPPITAAAPLDLIRWPEAVALIAVGLAAGWVMAWEMIR